MVTRHRDDTRTCDGIMMTLGHAPCLVTPALHELLAPDTDWRIVNDCGCDLSAWLVPVMEIRPTSALRSTEQGCRLSEKFEYTTSKFISLESKTFGNYFLLHVWQCVNTTKRANNKNPSAPILTEGLLGLPFLSETTWGDLIGIWMYWELRIILAISQLSSSDPIWLLDKGGIIIMNTG